MLTASRCEITNWCNTHKLGVPVEYHIPDTESAAQEFIKKNVGRSRVQILGNRYSWPTLINVNKAAVLSPSRLGGVTIRRDAVEVSAGTSLLELSAMLRTAGMQLACSLPVIGDQSVGGAVATGTHGQGLRQSTIGDAVTQIRLVNAKGEICQIEHENDIFGAYILNLGCLGYMTRATFRLRNNTVYTCEKRTISYRELLTRFRYLNESSLTCKYWWFPWEDCVHVWRARVATSIEKRNFDNNGQRPLALGTREPDANEAVDACVGLIAHDTKTADVKLPQFRTVLRFRNAEDVTGYYDDIFCRGIPVPQINCEVGVPLVPISGILEEIRSSLHRQRQTLHYPIILRVTGPSKAWLSPAFARKTCYLGFVIYRARDGTFSRQAFRALDQLQSLLASADGFPHWGKYFRRRYFNFRKMEKWEHFQDVRRSCDPDGYFLSSYLRSIFDQT